MGLWKKKERSDALDIMGISSQLIFPSVGAGRLRAQDLAVVYGGCDALNRGMADFVPMTRAFCPWAIYLCVIPSVRKRLSS